MDVFSFLFSGLKTLPEENSQTEKKDVSTFDLTDAKSTCSSNPLNQNVPQNMLKILESFQNPTSKAPANHSQPEDELLNLMKGFVTPQHKQVSNIILSSNIPQEQKKDFEDLKKIPQIQNNSLKFEDKNSEVLSNASQKSQNKQNMNDFLFLSKVATMCNQLNVEDRQKKDKSEKEDEEEKDFEEIKLKSKKIKKLNWGCGHFEREHYAKNLCNNCYRKYGRNKKPWNCPHNKLYAHGLCQNCYINKYNQVSIFFSQV